MFNHKHSECVGFESRWVVKRVSEVASSQTEENSKSDSETNTAFSETAEVQTETKELTSAQQVTSEEDEKLAKWLKRIYPQVKRELDDAAHSKAFKGYRLSGDSSDATCKLLQTVKVSDAQNKDRGDIGSYISGLSWNSTNRTLAVSCIYKHKSWCFHEGFIALYTLTSDDMLSNVPQTKLTADACVMVLQFHPVLPSVIAAGLFTGMIVVWNVQNTEEQVVAKINAHELGITQLAWIDDINSPKNALLASSSLDSYLNLWEFDISSTSKLILMQRFQIKSPFVPKKADPEEADTATKHPSRGIICFDFSKHNPSKFLVGAEGGMIVECSLLGTVRLRSKSETPVYDPVVKYYEEHKGEVSSVSFSPNRKDMFMTYGTDLEIRIYMMDQEDPAQIIFLKDPLVFITWIPYEEKIVSGCGHKGCLEIFQVVKGKAIENITKEKVSGANVLTQIGINRAKTSIVAVATENGHVQMWRVPWTLFGNLNK